MSYQFILLGLCATLAACSGSDKKTDPVPTQPTTDQTTTTADGQPAQSVVGEFEGTTAFKVGDLLVIHKPIKSNQVVSAQLYFMGGSSRLDATTQGIQKLALSVAAQGGTTSMPKDQYNAKLDALGASIGSFTDRDYAGVTMKTVSPYFGDVWDMFTQVVLSPAMPEKEIELIRKRQLNAYNTIFENNDSLVSYTASKMLFKGHPYEYTQLGTDKTIPTFTKAQLEAHQKSLLDPSQMFLVVVGDVPQDMLRQKVEASFGALKSTGSKLTAPPVIASQAPNVSFVAKDIPTNYIFGLFPAPEPSSADYPAMVVGMDYLSDRLFEEVRTKRNLTYAVSAGLSDKRSNYGYFYVTAVDPAKTMPVIFAEVDKIVQTPLNDQQITETMNIFLTQYYMSQETNSSQASMLADAQITTGDWRNAPKFINALRQVKPADIQRVMTKYVKNVQFGVVGKDPKVVELESLKR